jgi:hypothetical protein
VLNRTRKLVDVHGGHFPVKFPHINEDAVHIFPGNKRTKTLATLKELFPVNCAFEDKFDYGFVRRQVY